MNFIQKIFSVKNDKNKNRKIIHLLGFKFKIKLRRKISLENETELLENVFKKHHNKKALISYIKYPFVQGLNKYHTNTLECYSAAKIFDELGYQVDVVEYNTLLRPSKVVEYEIVYGFGNTYALTLTNPKIKSIHYATCCCILYSNVLTSKKVIDFAKQTGVWLPDSARYMDSDISTTINFSDLIIVLGNNFVKNTFDTSCTLALSKSINTKSLNCFYYDVYNIDINNKDFKNIKNNFLYFGSSGALHKGFDIVIDIFKRRKDINLTICGVNINEWGLADYYGDVFNNQYENIKFQGLVNIESDLFKNIMNNSIAIVSPSVSEGGGVAALTVMANGGLIPVVSKSSGLDVEQYGFMFDEISVEAVEKQIDKLLQTEENTLKVISQKVKDETREIYTYDNYYNNLKNLIKSEIMSKASIENEVI